MFAEDFFRDAGGIAVPVRPWPPENLAIRADVAEIYAPGIYADAVRYYLKTADAVCKFLKNMLNIPVTASVFCDYAIGEAANFFKFKESAAVEGGKDSPAGCGATVKC